MKKSVLILLVFGFVSLGQAFAGSGSAIIPNISANTNTGADNVYYISNITNHDVEVTVTFYDKDGAVLTSGVNYSNFAASNTEIAAGKTGVITFAPSSWEYGYAVIEWNNKGTDNDVVALVANGYIEKDASPQLSRYTVLVNCGLAF